MSASEARSTGAWTPVRLESQARSHPGARRASNEDRVVDRPDLALWAVADGMGGLAHGEVAAERVTGAAVAAASRAGSGYARLNTLLAALERVNAELFGETSGPHDATGSTVVALLAHEDHFACLWAGDSRAYLYRDGELSQLTRDHSVVQQLIDEGVVAARERQAHPFSHVLTRAVGASGRIDIDRCFGRIQPGDVILLCSDGLTNALAEADLRTALQDEDLGAAADALIARALQCEATDDVSFVLVRRPSPAFDSPDYSVF